MNEPYTTSLAAIRARRAAIATQRQALDAEEQELAVAERVVARLGATAMPRPNGNGRSQGERPPAESPAPARQADLVIATLKASASPWVETSADLQTQIKEIHGVEIPKNSLLPLLSRLTADKIVARDGPKLALKERVHGG